MPARPNCLRLTLILAGLFLLVRPAPAGLYNFAELDEGARSEDYQKFNATLVSLQSLAADKVEFDYPLRKRYRLAAELGAKANLAGLSVEQKINLSAAFIRTRRHAEAIKLLTPLASQQRNNPFVHANLGMAYQLAGGQESRALDSLEEALRAWPKDWDKVSEAKKKDYLDLGFSGAEEFQQRRVEESYHLKLLKLRAREPKRPYENVDALFGDGKNPVRFVGESGHFEPGKIAKTEKEKLDAVRKDAADPRPIDIVQQLLVWLPDDLRLQWLLAELYNAEGNIAAARFYFGKLGGAGNLDIPRITAKEFVARRQVMLQIELPDEPGEDPGELDKRLKDAEELKRKQAGAVALVDWRSLAVGAFLGAAVALFTLWQIREWRRRKQPRRALPLSALK